MGNVRYALLFFFLPSLSAAASTKVLNLLYRALEREQQEVIRRSIGSAKTNTSFLQRRSKLSEGRSSPFCEHLVSVLREQNKNPSEIHVLGQSKPLVQDCFAAADLQGKVGLSSTPLTVGKVLAKDAQNAWSQIPDGGLLFVQNDDAASFDDLIWQALYQVHSTLYFKEIQTHFGKNANLELPRLRFVSFFPGGLALQKASSRDLEISKGNFLYKAAASGTDKIDAAHNYSLEYHRFMDHFPMNRSGMMVEIGLGCTMAYGAGASAKIWPALFPNLSVRFVEIDRPCTEKWLPQMKAVGVSKVYIGPQENASVLAEIISDAHLTPGGLQLVVDDGGHNPSDILKSFRSLFPSVAHNGLYFVEDIMFSNWAGGLRGEKVYPIESKSARQAATPIGLTAVLAEIATGAKPTSSSEWSGMLAKQMWGQVNFIECSPGVCTFRHT
mmetsp:Transcript_81334/g.174082  ORF Transcript_81334/g.174082 Transcript_81334/m.174082 type:complete len:441 (-) Transcript_81334:303-1625(-)